MDRLESIKEKVESWEDELVLNREDAEYLLQRLERYEKALELGIRHIDGKGEIFSEREKEPVLYQLKEALKD